MTGPWTLTFPADLAAQLHAHLFPGDSDEHGAVIGAAVARTPHGTRLLARDILIAEDGVSYVEGRRSHRTLSAAFVREAILHCREQGLVYLAVHNHGGSDRAGFSPVDLASHRRGYPTLVDINLGMPVGALVFAENAMAGELYLADGSVERISHAVVLEGVRRELRSNPRKARPSASAFDRQSRLFGDVGQEILGELQVAIIGAGGVGSVLVELLARLGVGRFIIVDPDVVEVSNLSRLIGAHPTDAGGGISSIGRRSRKRPLRKVDLASRVIASANPDAQIVRLYADLQDPAVATQLIGCDYLFLAADSMQARLVFNALVHQYLIPGVQLGAKVSLDMQTGRVLDAFSVIRPVLPGVGCLWCNELISPGGLQAESIGEDERQGQHYIDDPVVIVPSVVTLNSVAAAHAADDFLFWAVGLATDPSRDYLVTQPRNRSVRFVMPRRDPNCSECSRVGRFARGDNLRLPTRQS